MGPNHRVGFRSWAAHVFVVPALCLFLWSPASAVEPLRMLAAASTIAAINDAANVFSQRTKIPVVTVFASSGALARQIAAGAPGHLYLSADPKWMDWAQSRGGVAGSSRRALLGNRLVLATRKGSGRTYNITKSFDLPALLNGARLAIADPAHAPLGAQARAALIWLGVWDRIAPRALRLSDAAQARVLVERGEAAFGILYRSDTAANARLEAAGVFPPESHPVIRYEIALTRNAATNPAARRLYEWLSGAEARRIFTRFGFAAP